VHIRYHEASAQGTHRRIIAPFELHLKSDQPPEAGTQNQPADADE